MLGRLARSGLPTPLASLPALLQAELSSFKACAASLSSSVQSHEAGTSNRCRPGCQCVNCSQQKQSRLSVVAALVDSCRWQHHSSFCDVLFGPHPLHTRSFHSSPLLEAGLKKGGAGKQGAAAKARAAAANPIAVMKDEGPIWTSTMAPWTPTRLLPKRKVYRKRMGNLVQALEKEHVQKMQQNKAYPVFHPGDLIQVKLSVPENRGKESVFAGVCIAQKYRGLRSAFTLRNYIPGGGGIERTFPLYSPNILDIRVLESRPARRAKLYYIRELKSKEYTVRPQL